MKIDLKLDSIKIYNYKLSSFLLPDQIDLFFPIEWHPEFDM